MAETTKLIAKNRRATHDYYIEDRFECGIELKGTEVKSLRQGKASLQQAYADVRNGEVFIYQLNISPYEHGNIFNVDPLRVRKLLLHKREIRKLSEEIKRQGYTLVPLSLYFKGNKVKLELALAKGKKLYDKRKSIKEKDDKRKMRKYSDY